MEARAARSVFLAAVLSTLLPVADVHRCVTYKHNVTCGFKGSTVDLPCSYPNDTEVTEMFWARRLYGNSTHEALSAVAAYSGRAKYLRGAGNDCTLRLTDLKESDASYYYVAFYFKYFSGANRSCVGYPGVWLHIPPSAVIVRVQEFVNGQKVPVAGQKVTEGQRIILTCVPTCAATLNSDPAYIWYKNRLKLSDGAAKASLLSLDPISNEDTGSYSCAMIGYKDLPSPAVNLRVQYGPRNTMVSVEISADGTGKGSVMTLTCSSDANPPVHEYTWYKRSREGEEVLQKGGREALVVVGGGGGASLQDDDAYLCEAANSVAGQNSTAHNLKKYLKATEINTFLFSVILVASACVGLTVTVVVAGAFLALRIKKRFASSASELPHPDSDPNADLYTALDVRTMSPAVYETLDKARGCSDADEDSNVYDSLDQYQPGGEEFHEMRVMP